MFPESKNIHSDTIFILYMLSNPVDATENAYTYSECSYSSHTVILLKVALAYFHSFPGSDTIVQVTQANNARVAYLDHF